MRTAVAITVFGALAAAQSPSEPLEGYWKNPSGTAIIAISPCGKLLCGTVAWASARGQREVARTAPHVVGTRVLSDLKRWDGHWSGNLFIPDDNIHVSAKLQLVGTKELKLTGCAVIGLFCRSQLWTRVEPPLPSD